LRFLEPNAMFVMVASALLVIPIKTHKRLYDIV
jgi:hypothetical protein